VILFLAFLFEHQLYNSRLKGIFIRQSAWNCSLIKFWWNNIFVKWILEIFKWNLSENNNNFSIFFWLFSKLFLGLAECQLWFSQRNSEQLCVLKNWTINSKIISHTFLGFTFHQKPLDQIIFFFFFSTDLIKR
jgi:hypothetical protein